MLNLVLAIASSAIISIIMRVSEEKRKSDAGMFIWNYLVCMALSLLYTKEVTAREILSGLDFVLILGVISGVLFLVSFALMQKNIKINGVVSTAVFMKLGVVVSILIAVIAFAERPKMLQGLGIVIALLAIIIFNYDKNSIGKASKPLLLILLLIISGVTDSMVNIYNKIGLASLSDVFFIVLFSVAFVSSIVLYFYKRISAKKSGVSEQNMEYMGKWDVIFGLIIGIPNYYSSRFLLKALEAVPSVIAYPTYSVCTIFIICIAGVLIFKEHVSMKKWVALALVLVSVAMMQ